MIREVYQDSNFSFSVEDGAMGWVCHCEVEKWSKEVYSKMLDVLAATLNFAPRATLFVVAPSEDKKLIKFASLLGFESFDTFQHEGEDMELMELCLGQ